MAEVTIDLARDGDMGYIAFTHVGRGEVAVSVPLEPEAVGEPATLNDLILDFDRDGRLVGIEIVGRIDQVLPQVLLAAGEPS